MNTIYSKLKSYFKVVYPPWLKEPYLIQHSEYLDYGPRYVNIFNILSE